MINAMSGLRAAQQEQTRRAILDAYLHLVHKENAATVSVPAVAKQAGVSIRTVYRYFPTKSELQTGAAYRLTEEVQREVVPTQSVDRSNLQAFLTYAWSDFAERIPALSAEHCTPAGRELRQTRLADARPIAKANLPVGFQDEETVDLIVALISSSMFLELVDRMGHAPERAAAMATRVCHLVLDEAERQAAEVAENGTDPAREPIEEESSHD